jgi:hypothetical protein
MPPALPARIVGAVLTANADSLFAATRQRTGGSRLTGSMLLDRDTSDKVTLLYAIARHDGRDQEQTGVLRQVQHDTDEMARDDYDARTSVLDRVFDALGAL